MQLGMPGSGGNDGSIISLPFHKGGNGGIGAFKYKGHRSFHGL